MLKANKIILIVFLLFSSLSCKFINFVDMSVSSTIDENQRFFYGDYICLDFSYTPDYLSVENQINLKKDGNKINIDIEWENRKCRINPSNNWELGKDYQLFIDGDIKTLEAGLQKVYLNRHFIYGKESELFSFLSCSVKEKAMISQKQTIVFEFSKPVNQVSFNEGFLLSPSVDIEKKFEGNKVYITPISKWPINTYFEWTLESIFSSDAYVLNRSFSGIFCTEEDLELPEIESISRVSIYENNYAWLDDNLNNLLIGNGIGFIFSKSMDHISVSNAISFIPNIKGDLVLVPNTDNKKFVFIPSSNYKIDTDYKLTVAKSCKDINSYNLKKDYTTLFHNANEYLKVTNISEEHYESGMPDIEIYNGNSTDPINTIKLPSGYNADSKININITFSKAIAESLRSKAAESVSFSLLFPAKYNSIKVNSVRWNQTGNIVQFSLSNFSVGAADVPIYYQISINGGENGVINSAGEYLEENVCVTFKTSSN